MKKLLAAIAFVILGIAAARAQCPIEVTKVDPYHYYMDNKFVLEIHFKNVSDKEISGVRFKVYLITAVGDMRETLENPLWDGHAKPGKTVKAQFRNWIYVKDAGKADGWPTRIMFKDGTIWEDDGSHSCNMGVGTISPKGNPLHQASALSK